ncbi:MAG: methylcobamide--CoM methyltransferase [Chloroflexi bacterium]|nr:methylcobamide--CoM methyltransferase [Chloroflexota bacterium]
MITTVVGNYPKVPSLSGGPNLRRALTRFDEGHMSAEELGGVVQAATRDAITEQVDAGIDIVTDGHIRWEDGQTYFARHLSGFSVNGLLRYFDSNTYFRQPVVEGPIGWTGPISVGDYEYAAAESPRPVKAVVTGPYTLTALSRTDRPRAEVAMELAHALREELLALQQAGCPLIQVDEPAALRAGDDASMVIQTLRELTAGVTAKLALYTYFGDATGLAPDLFDLPFQVFGLDFVSGPANFDLLEGLPAGKELGAGLLDARNTKMESTEEIVSALRRISRLVPLDRVHLNPSCGLEFLPRANAHQKLVRLVAAARAADQLLS